MTNDDEREIYSHSLGATPSKLPLYSLTIEYSPYIYERNKCTQCGLTLEKYRQTGTGYEYKQGSPLRVYMKLEAICPLCSTLNVEILWGEF